MRSRADALAHLTQDTFDLLVIGGGITGAGVALDAATRGFSVALVERDDWSSGTSSRSSKMIHGGLRYLENFDLGLVREALLERELLARLAPHLVKPLPFLVTAFEGKRRDRRIGVGLNMYDVMARRGLRRGKRDRDGDGEPDFWSPDRHRTIDGQEVLELVPALASREPTSAYLFYDCQTDDSRMVLTVLGEAERFGSVCMNGARAVEVTERNDRAAGAICEEAESGERFEIRADSVVNATGVWADRLRTEELREVGVTSIRPSRGTHILIDRDRLPMKAAAIIPAGGGRGIFVLPWLGQTLVGTTDNDYDGDIDHVRPSDVDVRYLLDAVNEFFDSDFGIEDVAGAYAGVRPLISGSDGDEKKSVDISRKAELYETPSGMLTITGGKFTTWRRMAKMTVDRLVEREFRDAPCKTDQIPFGYPVEISQLREIEGLSPIVMQHLANRYGLFAERILDMCEQRPDLCERIVDGMPDIMAEVVVAARFEQARSVGDVLLRRTRLGLLCARRLADDPKVAKRVAKLMGSELGWGMRRTRRETDTWREVVAAEGIVANAAAIEASAA
ncbi:MAG: glycerol-3-phosphate dehydrogenase/oxidase [Phycisphaeraceae bacterium]